MAITMSDNIDSLPQRVEAASKAASKLMEYYRDLRQVDIPTKILLVGDGVEVATEALIPKLHADEFAKWRKRAVKIEAVNGALKRFETQMMLEFTQPTLSIMAKQFHSVLRKGEWLVGHADQILAIGDIATRAADEKFGDRLLDGIAELLVHVGLGDLTGANTARQELQSSIEKASSFIASVVIAVIALNGIEAVLSAFSAESFRENILPVLNAKKACEEEIMAAAFPVGKRGRARRKKQHRVRS